MNLLFTFEVLIVVVLIAVVLIAIVYMTVTGRRRGRDETAVEEGPRRGDAGTAEPRREYQMRLGLETTEEMKVRLYSLDEYEKNLGGSAGALGSGRFVGALKAYRTVDGEWYDYPPRRAADELRLAPEDYEVDGERGVLVLRRLPSGLPESARDVL